MQLVFNKRFWLAAAVAAVLSLTVGTVLAHEGRPVGDYNINVGWIVEPAYEGFPNGVEVRVIKVAGSDGDDHHGESTASADDHHGESTASADHHHGESTSAADDHHGDSGAVEGLQNTLQVEVVYVPTGASRVVNLSADADSPGRYTVDLIPSAPGVYEMRVFGAIEGMLVDETFASHGGGGDFDDILSPAALQFPEELPSARELESAVRGAISTAEQAQDAASQGDSDALPIAALALGVLGAVLGAGGLIVGLRRR